jgi:transposase
MALREPKRTLCSCREAAEILGCTMGRVRQLCRKKKGEDEPELWSRKLTGRALALDLEQVKRLAKVRQRARDAGIVRGARPGGFSPDT